MQEAVSSLRYILGIDVGGTFVDVFCLDRESGRSIVAKAPSSPAAPGQDVIEGISSVARALDLGDERALLSRTKLIFHGSTVATNMMLTLAAEPVGLITTDGFRDILELRGGMREETFNNRLENAVPLSPRRLRCEIDESTDRTGRILRSVRADEIDAALAKFQAAGLHAVAICFKNAYANPANEEAAEAMVRERWPEAFVTRSTALTNRARLYDRVSSAVVNCFVGPKTSGYIAGLQRQLAALGFDGRLLIMGGNGGAMSPAEAGRYPAKLILSGPAGGPVAGQLTLAAADRPLNGIVVDMGGTSFDVSVVRNGRVPVVSRREVNRYRVAVPMLDIHTLAAGGGSIAWLDKVGLLKVGPHSAGSVPGPACYGLGGEEPTVTDANLVLGYLDPDAVLGGTRRLDPERARAAISRRIAEPLGLTVHEAAAGIHRVATANMIVGVREMTVERGLDPRGLPLILAGGAAGLHGAEIAEGLGITEVIAPRHAGVFCALGMALTTLRYDHNVTLMQSLSSLDPAALRATLAIARERLREAYAELEHDLTRVDFELEIEARYVGQFHELSIPIEEADLLSPENGRLLAAFHAAHTDAYGFAQRTSEVQIVNLRVTAIGVLEGQAARADHGAAPLSFTPTAPRQVWLGGATQWRAAGSYVLAERTGDRPHVGNIEGPALVDLPTSTLLVPPSWMCSVTPSGDLHLARQAMPLSAADTIAVPQSPGRASRFLRRLTARSLEIVIPVAILIVLWQGIVSFHLAPDFLVPPPAAVFDVMVDQWSLLMVHTAVTTLEVTLGFIFAAAIGVPLGWLIVSSSLLERTIYPLMVGSQAVPKVALGPIFVIAFGYGVLPKVILATLVAFFPIAAGSAVGFTSLDSGWFLLTRSMRASRLQTFFKLQIPAGLPSIFGGLKVGAALAVVGAVVGEFIGADSGLSYLLLIANSNRDTATEFACLILLSVMGIVFFGLVALAEAICLPWRDNEANRWSTGGTP